MKLIGLLAMTACGGSSALSNPEYDELAAVVGSQIATPERAGDFGVVTDAITIARGSVPKGFALNENGEVTGIRGEISYRYQIACLQPWALAACDPPAASAVVHAAWGGRLAMTTFAGPIDRTAVLRLDELASPMASVSGTSAVGSQVATFLDTGRSYQISGTTSLILFADMPSHAMMGGALESSFDVDTGDGTYAVGTELSITGSPLATLVLDGTHAYVLDLGTGAVTPN